MKNILIASFAVSLVGCANLGSTSSSNSITVPEAVTALAVDKEMPPMSRSEVIAAINECEAAGTRPILINAKRKVNNQIVPSIIEVTCLPKYK